MEEVLKSDLILQQISQDERAEKIADSDEEKIGLLVFQLAGDLFAFHGSQSREILPFTGVTWIPGATALIPGVINVRGDVVAVLDLKQILGMTPTANDAPAGGFVVMLRTGDGRNGVLVDHIVDVVETPVAANGPVLATLDERLRRFATSQFEYDHKMVTVLNVDAMIAKMGSQ